MYIRKEKRKNKNTIKNTITQSKSYGKQSIGFINNLSGGTAQRKLLDVMDNNSSFNRARIFTERNTLIQRVPIAKQTELRNYFDLRIMEIGSPTSNRHRQLFEEVNQLADIDEAKRKINEYVTKHLEYLEDESADIPDEANNSTLPREVVIPPIGRINLPTNTNLHELLMTVILSNHRSRPYATDFFHEKKPLMQAIMTNEGVLARIGYFLSALGEALHIVKGYNVEDRPQIRILGIEVIINPQMAGLYRRAVEDMQMRNGTQSPEYMLAAGHSPGMIDTIAHTGYRPDLGQYHAVKGHGALGRGSYFTDRVDKAVSYSGNTPETKGQFLLSTVATGQTLERDSGDDLRHETHNEMVREDRNNLNQISQEGRSEHDLSQYDSILGREQHQSGGSAISALRRSRQGEFDSNEWLVRNGDQVLPSFIVHYEVLPKPRRSSRWLTGTLTVMGTGLAIIGGYLWFKKKN